MKAVEIKAFVPARDFALSKQFYLDLGFECPWSDENLAYFKHGNCPFFLQNFYDERHASNFMMHMIVDDVEAWRKDFETKKIASKYGIKISGLQDQPWRQRDFTLLDPTGVLWRIGQNIPPRG